MRYPRPVERRRVARDTVAMSEFHVTPEHVLQSTQPMHGICGAIADVHGQIGAHTDAAGGTSVAGTVQSIFAVWSAALPQYAEAADRMIASMTLSAAGYSHTDDAIADQSTPEAR